MKERGNFQEDLEREKGRERGRRKEKESYFSRSGRSIEKFRVLPGKEVHVIIS